MVNFFVPYAKDADQAEEVYKAFESYPSYPLRHPTARLFQIKFFHDGKRYVAEVGREIDGWPEPEGPVLGIVETTGLLCVYTPHRLPPSPIMVGPSNLIGRIYFDDRRP